MKDFKETVVMDFDGVIHSYISGWKGINVIPDPPVDGAKEFIEELRKDYVVVVLSTRCVDPDGIYAIKNWLKENDITVDDVVSYKPPCKVTIDDRAICFNGDFVNLKIEIDSFKSWVKRGQI